MNIYYENEKGSSLCFRYAMKAANKGENIKTCVEIEDADGYDSYYGLAGLCRVCIEEIPE